LRLCNWQEVFRLPLIYVSIAGLGANQFQLSIPALLFQPQAMLGQAIIPLMLVSLGYRQDPRASRLHRGTEHVHVRGDHPHRVLADHVTQGKKEKKPKNS
jgi:hypothetical protein